MTHLHSKVTLDGGPGVRPVTEGYDMGYEPTHFSGDPILNLMKIGVKMIDFIKVCDQKSIIFITLQP